MKKALYYPFIEPKDKKLLLNSLLYWDQISTIVPESMETPFESSMTKELETLKILTAERINSDSIYVEEAGYDILSMLEENKLGELIVENGKDSELIYLEKLSPDLARIIEYSPMYPEKMPSYIRGCLKSGNKTTVAVEKNFSSLYMSLLAKKISLHNHMTPFTDTSTWFNLPFEHRTNSERTNRRCFEFERYSGRSLNYKNSVEGMAVTATLEMFKINENVKPEKLLVFKEKYQSELLRFRTSIESITPPDNNDISAKSLVNFTDEHIKGKIIPAISDLKKALSGSAMSLLPNTLSIATTLAVPTAGYFSLTNLSKPEALGISLAVYLVTSLFKMRKDRFDKLNSNSYSYLFHINQELS